MAQSEGNGGEANATTVSKEKILHGYGCRFRTIQGGLLHDGPQHSLSPRSAHLASAGSD